MTFPPRIDDARRKVWIAFAEHFLDTETPQGLPMSALAAVEGGFSVEEAREIWRYEVTPVVGRNLWDVAGEWAGWYSGWLVEEVSRVARRRTGPPSLAARLGYRLTIAFCDRYWVAIERLMVALEAVELPARRAVAQDLALLASHYFNFVPGDFGLGQPGRREALGRLYVEVFLPALRPAVFQSEEESPIICASRVEEAFVSQAAAAGGAPPEHSPI